MKLSFTESKLKCNPEMRGASPEKLQDSKLKQFEKSSSTCHSSGTHTPSLKMISVVGSINGSKLIEKTDVQESQSEVHPLIGILKSSEQQSKVTERSPEGLFELISAGTSSSQSRFISQCDINLQPLAEVKQQKSVKEKDIDNGVEPKASYTNEYVELVETKVEQPNPQTETSETLQPICSHSSSAHLKESMLEQDIDAVCNTISQTLKRIRQEKFGNYTDSENSIQTVSDVVRNADNKEGEFTVCDCNLYK